MAAAARLGQAAQPEWLMGWLPLAFLLCVALAAGKSLPSWAFMWALAFSIFAGLKWLSWWRTGDNVPHAAWRSAAYLLAWPGMDAEAFLGAGKRIRRPAGREWLAAISKTILGAGLFWGAASTAGGMPLLQGWIGMVGLILLLHFGSFHVVALIWRSLGVDARPIMSAPLRSSSLNEFWGKRWNLGFRQLSYDLVFLPLHGRLGVWPATFLIFVLSGLIHDLVISVPARGGYGLPTAYFVLQGLGVAVERSTIGRRLGLREGARGWLFMAAWTAGPAFWLFHPPFVLHVILPFMKAVKAL
jgi:alginate O-acetyltransferase complex protein AlgI